MSASAPLAEIFSSVQGEGPYVGVRQVFAGTAIRLLPVTPTVPAASSACREAIATSRALTP